MGDAIGLGLLSIAVYFEFWSTNVSEPELLPVSSHHPLITQLSNPDLSIQILIFFWSFDVQM